MAATELPQFMTETLVLIQGRDTVFTTVRLNFIHLLHGNSPGGTSKSQGYLNRRFCLPFVSGHCLPYGNLPALHSGLVLPMALRTSLRSLTRWTLLDGHPTGHLLDGHPMGSLRRCRCSPHSPHCAQWQHIWVLSP